VPLLKTKLYALSYLCIATLLNKTSNIYSIVSLNALKLLAGTPNQLLSEITNRQVIAKRVTMQGERSPLGRHLMATLTALHLSLDASRVTRNTGLLTLIQFTLLRHSLNPVTPFIRYNNNGIAYLNCRPETILSPLTLLIVNDPLHSQPKKLRGC
jgi:hypothetical protein